MYGTSPFFNGRLPCRILVIENFSNCVAACILIFTSFDLNSFRKTTTASPEALMKKSVRASFK